MSTDTLSLFAGSVLSLLFSYVPGLNSKFEQLDSTYKRLAMAGLLLVVALAVVGIACAGFAADLGLAVTCDKAGAIGVLRSFVLALVANQSTYAISPRRS